MTVRAEEESASFHRAVGLGKLVDEIHPPAKEGIV